MIAIALQEQDWETLYRRAIEAEQLLMSCGTLQEVLIVAFRKGIITEVNQLLNRLDADYVPVDQDLAEKAAELYQHFGKGTLHPAKLNYGDCFAAALASVQAMPLLFCGVDFQAAGY
ncbi:MAG: type II toxin-antitoxin system VapC family toxin [Cyanobacteria bacterium P01_F01_bin.42]